jgi:intergrase/recombinase
MNKRLDKHVGIAPWRLHDIRRIVGNRLSALKVPHEVAELIIGHGKKGLARVYDQHEYIDEMREAPELWAQKLSAINKERPDLSTRAGLQSREDCECQNL